MTDPIRIVLVPDNPCPGCGAHWGHPDPALDFPNRVKVDDLWKCYNPDCEVGFYTFGGEVAELKPSPEQAAASAARIAEDIAAMMDAGRWVSQGFTSQLIGKDDPLPEGWQEGVGAI